MRTFLAAAHEALHDSASPVYRRTALIIGWLIVISCVVLVIELLLWPDSSPPAALLFFDDLLLVFFTAEIALRLATYRPPEADFYRHDRMGRWRALLWGRLRYALRPLNLIDLITVLALLPALRGFRAVRLLRLARTPRWFRYSSPLEGLSRAFRENSLLFGFGLSVLLVATIVGGLTVYLLDRGRAEGLESVGDGLWWAIVTLTTVGFGDITPASPMARVVAVGLMISGMFVLALFAGIVGHTLLNSILTIRQEHFRMSGYLDHVVILGYSSAARPLLDALIEEVGDKSLTLVVFSTGERPPDLPPTFVWVPGDPTKESELPKARLGHARVAIVVGSRSVEPQHADAITLMTLFTVRQFLASHRDYARRERPLHLVAEILERENVPHARAAGASEVIETARLGFSLLAHAVTMPGTAEVMARVASTGANSLYACPVPTRYAAPLPFSELARRFKAETGALAIGVRAPDRDENLVNPAADYSVGAGYEVLYLATAPVDTVPYEEQAPPLPQ